MVVFYILACATVRPGRVRGSSAGKESACNAGDPGSIPGSGRSPEEGIGYPLQYSWTSLVAQTAKNLPATWETWVWSLVWEDPLEEGMSTHSSILPGESCGQRRLTGYSPRGYKESDTTEPLSTHSTQWEVFLFLSCGRETGVSVEVYMPRLQVHSETDLF